mgnify:CR=1 FL=1
MPLKYLDAHHRRCLGKHQPFGANKIVDAHNEHGFTLNCVSIGATEIGIDILAAFFNQLRRPAK